MSRFGRRRKSNNSDDSTAEASPIPIKASETASTTETLSPTTVGEESTTTTSARRKRKRVRFAPQRSLTAEVVLIPICYELSERQRRSIWYARSSFPAFRLAGKTAAHDVRLDDKEFVVGLDAGYTRARTVALSILDDKQMEQVLQNVDAHVGKLQRWSSRKDSCRGLEHWSSRSHYDARKDALTDAKNIVLELCHDPYNRNRDDEEISKQYQEYSRPSRILARFLGACDAVAAREAMIEEQT